MGNLVATLAVITCNAAFSYLVLLELEKAKTPETNSNKALKNREESFIGWKLSELPLHTSPETYKKVLEFSFKIFPI